MSKSAGMPAPDTTGPNSDGLHALALALLRSGADAGSGEAETELPREEPLVLRIEDLLTDDRGEIVLSAAESLQSVILTTDQEVTASGIAEPDRKASGEEVGGFNYLMFATGATVYFAPGLEVEVVAPGG